EDVTTPEVDSGEAPTVSLEINVNTDATSADRHAASTEAKAEDAPIPAENVVASAFDAAGKSEPAVQDHVPATATLPQEPEAEAETAQHDVDTAKPAGIMGFIEAQLGYLGDHHRPAKEPAPPIENVEPEPKVESPALTPKDPDPWNVDTGTLFAMEPVVELNEPKEVPAGASATIDPAQMPLDFTRPLPEPKVDKAIAPAVEPEIQSTDVVAEAAAAAKRTIA